MSEFIGYVLLSVGIAFDLFGCIGLVRLPDIYNRLQAATKCATLGTISVLLGTTVYMADGASGWKAALCGFFLLLTSPTAAHAIARGAHKSGVPLWKRSVGDQYAEDKGAAEAKE